MCWGIRGFALMPAALLGPCLVVADVGCFAWAVFGGCRCRLFCLGRPKGLLPAGAVPIGRSGAQAPDSRVVILVRRPNSRSGSWGFFARPSSLRIPSRGLDGPSPAGSNPSGLRCALFPVVGTIRVLGALWVRAFLCWKILRGPVIWPPSGGGQITLRAVALRRLLHCTHRAIAEVLPLGLPRHCPCRAIATAASFQMPRHWDCPIIANAAPLGLPHQYECRAIAAAAGSRTLCHGGCLPSVSAAPLGPSCHCHHHIRP
jgi:hypothetical protein